MVHIITSDKRKKIKFIDKLLRSAEESHSQSKTMTKESKQRIESIVDRIKNDLKIPSEEKERLIESTKPFPISSEKLKNLKIISKLDPSAFKKVINNISPGIGGIKSYDVRSDDKMLKDLLKPNEEE